MRLRSTALCAMLLTASGFISAETVQVTTTGDITPTTTHVQGVTAQGKCTYVGELTHDEADQKSYVVLYEVKYCSAGGREIVSKTIDASTRIGEIPVDLSCDPALQCPRNIPAGTALEVTL
ncbi:hypothetical protein [Pseudomonas sp. NPDC089569]|uniref:hypothetical protein n=1 Tax=Pseudomonas sp. NPDC089569 TaxID=3390722 RepID=UPI003D0397D3